MVQNLCQPRPIASPTLRAALFTYFRRPINILMYARVTRFRTTCQTQCDRMAESLSSAPHICGLCTENFRTVLTFFSNGANFFHQLRTFEKVLST